MVSEVQFIFHVWSVQGMLQRQSRVGLHCTYIHLKCLQTTLP